MASHISRVQSLALLLLGFFSAGCQKPQRKWGLGGAHWGCRGRMRIPCTGLLQRNPLTCACHECSSLRIEEVQPRPHHFPVNSVTEHLRTDSLGARPGMQPSLTVRSSPGTVHGPMGETDATHTLWETLYIMRAMTTVTRSKDAGDQHSGSSGEAAVCTVGISYCSVGSSLSCSAFNPALC